MNYLYMMMKGTFMKATMTKESKAEMEKHQAQLDKSEAKLEALMDEWAALEAKL
jgi:hypothetical protein